MTDGRLAVGLDLALALASAAVLVWGVFALGWSPFIVMLLFWLENVVIGAFNVVKMLVAGARMGTAGLLGGVALATFFTVHYGLFTAVHGLFVVMLFGGVEVRSNATGGGFFAPLLAMAGHLLADRDGWLAVLAIVLLQLSLFVQWMARTRELPTALGTLMTAPYARIVILHVTLIAGGFLVQALQAPVAGALLLIGLKLVHDLITLGRAQKNAGEAAAQVKARRLLVIGRRNLIERP